jgi:potassium-transporting ATPase ATP-binding subunit
MDRALQANIIAKSGKAVELAGDVDIVLLDKIIAEPGVGYRFAVA